MFWSYPRLVWESMAAHAFTAWACYSYDSIARRSIEIIVAGVLVSEKLKTRLTLVPAEGQLEEQDPRMKVVAKVEVLLLAHLHLMGSLHLPSLARPQKE